MYRILFIVLLSSALFAELKIGNYATTFFACDPKGKNEVLSNLMDAGKLLFGRLNGKTWVENWLKLDVQEYLRDL